MSSVVKLFSERQAYWASQGLAGRELYTRLAADPELPISLEEPDAAAIVGWTPAALKQRRRRGMEPSFIRLSAKCVRYPREAYCRWLADMMCERAA